MAENRGVMLLIRLYLLEREVWAQERHGSAQLQAVLIEIDTLEHLQSCERLVRLQGFEPSRCLVSGAMCPPAHISQHTCNRCADDLVFERFVGISNGRYKEEAIYYVPAPTTSCDVNQTFVAFNQLKSNFELLDLRVVGFFTYSLFIVREKGFLAYVCQMVRWCWQRTNATRKTMPTSSQRD